MKRINLIDVEASGLDWESYPIEIAVLVEGRMHAWLIAPEPDWTYWDETAESLHGISRQELIEGGQKAARVAEELNSVLEDSNGVLYSDAARWDEDWVRTLFDSIGAVPLFHILPISDLLSADQCSAFEQTAERLASSGKYRRHRAEPDVRMIYEAYCRTLDLDH
jgi:hypothetical protein